MGWSAKQAAILSGGGTVGDAYERIGVARSELPHYHLQTGTVVPTFMKWAKEGRTSTAIVGAWKRPLFMGI